MLATATPDSRVAARLQPSPNHGERGDGRRPDMLILHYTGMPNADEALRWLCNPDSHVSAHYFVFENGHVLQLVPEARRAWHAGLSSWSGESDTNSRSIGIEIANPGHAGGLPSYPVEQIAGVTALCRDIVERRAIPATRVLAHSDVAPGRKADPGETFPWERLHRAGIGHYVRPAPIRPGQLLCSDDRGDSVEALQTMLARYGYGLAVTGHYDEMTVAVVRAFQRHFRPEHVDGNADASTIATLSDLLAARPTAVA